MLLIDHSSKCERWRAIKHNLDDQGALMPACTVRSKFIL